jgi:hypothetical protein
VNDQHGRYARLRYTAMGALAALAAVGAIAGTAALAAKPHAHAAATNSSTKTVPAGTVKNRPPQQNANNPNNPFLIAVQRLVNDGTITTTEGQAVDREILAGSVDPQTLTSSGFTQTQLQAVEQTLDNTKRALASGVTGGARAPKEPPPVGTGAPSGGKEPPPAGPGNNSASK